ncbi:Chromatin assembly factor 1 subunit B [Apophysomyces sp. BC1034]|nr:Chromatin assembly factor 1 subunit B [Apophysomyces sp. BC1034]
MIAKTLEINWHDGQAVYSIDFSPDGQRYATAGADSSIRIWSVKAPVEAHLSSKGKPNTKNTNSSPVNVDFLSELKRHTAPVNVVRFSPNGEYLASAGDDTSVILWKLSNVKDSTFGREYGDFEKESWTMVQMFYGHNKEIYDLAWSPCGQYFITGSIDNTARVWSVAEHHTHYVQGVAWDPLGQYVATQSSDSSDGALLITPAGLYKDADEPGTTEEHSSSDQDEFRNCAYIYPRNVLANEYSKPSIAIRWSRVFYKKRPEKKSCLFSMPYRLVYVVATQDAIYVYDTQQTRPLCVISGMHYASITDATWSPDGTILMFSSADGYCSAVVFAHGELGEIYERKVQTAPDVEMTDVGEAPQSKPRTDQPAVNLPDMLMVTSTKKRINPHTVPVNTNSVTPAAPDNSKKRRITPTLISAPIPR